MNIISINNISKNFKSKKILEDVSFSLDAGKLYGLLGPNGVGKSTTIEILCDIIEPDSGTVEKKSDLKIGYVPQEIAVYEELSAYENLKFFASLAKISDVDKRIKEVLTITNLNIDYKTKVKKFSGGMKRKLNIAIALLNNPGLLVMDEPFVGVDLISIQSIIECLNELLENDVSILCTSHNIRLMEDICDELFFMKNGQVIKIEDNEFLEEKYINYFQ